jgi:tetratricopeptide (TPR) repeat protein
LGGRPLYQAVRVRFARYHAAQCLQHIDSQQWPLALKALSTANRFGNEDPEVLRTNVTFLTRTSNDPRSLIYTIKRLMATGHSTPADILTLAKAYLNLGEIQEARQLHTALSAEQKEAKPGLELLAQVLRAEGRPNEAQDTLRRALLTTPDDPDSIFRLALLDYENTFPEIQNRARASMWELVTNQDKIALAALTFFARDKNLTAQEAERLLKAAEAHPQANSSQKLEILSAIIRLSPHRRDEILDAEVSRQAGKSLSEQAEVIAWLAREKQHTRILQLVPPEIALQSKDVFPYVAQALGEEGRWADLRRLLTGSSNLPVARARVQVWLAQAATKLAPTDRDTPRQHLENAVESALKTDDFGSLFAITQVAEEQGLYELAIRCYERIATGSPRHELDMLEKIYELALRIRDTPKLFQVSSKISQLRPKNGAFQDRVHYLSLLIGTDMERVQFALTRRERDTAIEGQTTRLPSAFLRALAAYRFRDTPTLQATLPSLTPQLPQLTPGQRAVVAGLLRSIGQQAEAFRLTESINDILLLPEERALLSAR